MAIEMPEVPVAKAVEQQPELEPEDIASVITQMILGHQVFIDVELLTNVYMILSIDGYTDVAERIAERILAYNNVERKFAHLVEEMKNNA